MPGRPNALKEAGHPVQEVPQAPIRTLALRESGKAGPGMTGKAPEKQSLPFCPRPIPAARADTGAPRKRGMGGDKADGLSPR